MKEKKKLSLPAWIFIGMLAGIVAGLIFAFAGLGDFTTEWIKPIGTIYVNLLKFLVVPVVLFSIADGVISLKDLKRVGSVGVKTFVYYMCTTALAVVIGLVLVNLFKGNFTPLPSADLGALELSVELDELDYAGVRVGDTLSYTLDAYGERTFSGTVTEIRPIGSARQNATYFDVRVTVPADVTILPGMNATVTLNK